MKERGILFSSGMVRAILDGRKTQTRRVLNPQPGDDIDNAGDEETVIDMRTGRSIRSPYGTDGDRLWVRETFWQAHRYPGTMESGESEPTRATAGRLVHFAADGDPVDTPNRTYPRGLRNGAIAAPDPYAVWLKRPSIFMPRWASRITLEITDLRVQRLQDISEDDALAEGVEPYTPPHGHISPDQRVPGPGFDGARLGDQPHRLPFADLWDSINGKRAPWSSNRWVWAISFRRIP